MVALTYAVGRLATKRWKAEGLAPLKSFFRRFMNALMEARAQQARREIARHAHLIPHTRDRNGNIVRKDLPFTGL